MKDKLFDILYNIAKNRLLVDIINCYYEHKDDVFVNSYLLEFIFKDKNYIIKLEDNKSNDKLIIYQYNHYPVLKEIINNDDYYKFKNLFIDIINNLKQQSEITLNSLHSICIKN